MYDHLFTALLALSTAHDGTVIDVRAGRELASGGYAMELDGGHYRITEDGAAELASELVAREVLWTYVGRDGVVRVWTRQDQDAHAAYCRRTSELIEELGHRRDEPIGGPGEG